MGKDGKKTSKANRTKKSTVGDLSPRDPKAVKGGKVSMQDIKITKPVDKSSPILF